MRAVRGSEAWTREIARLIAAGVPQGPAPPAGSEPVRVVIPMLVGASELFALREGLIAHALRQRGAEPLFVLCDGLSHCDARTFDHDSAQICRGCTASGLRSLAQLKLPATRLSEWIDAADREEVELRLAGLADLDLLRVHFRGIDLAPWVFGSTLRYLRAGRLDLENAEMASLARGNLRTALLMTAAASKLLLALAPDRLFSSHGLYATWGPWMALARAYRIASVIYGGGWRRGTLLYQHNAPRRMHCDDLWPHYRERPLTADENAELDDYFATREDNRAEFFRYFEQVDRDRESFLRRIGVAGQSFDRTFGLFTNVAFDAAEYESRGAFRDMFEWIEEVVEFFVQRPKLLLVIKVHPAESRFIEPTPTPWRVATRLAQRFGELPANVRIVPSDDPVSPFLIYSLIDAGLVHTSTVGLELALAGKPVLTSGSGVHYEKPGIAQGAKSREEFFAKLHSLIANPQASRPDRELVRRYAYTLYFRKSVPFEPLDVDGWEPIASRVDTLADLAPGRFPGLDRLCAAILESQREGNSSVKDDHRLSQSAREPAGASIM